MSIDIPPALQWVSYLAGSKWPQGDEDGLWRIGEHWHGSASEMSDLIPDLDRVRNETMSVITGETASTAEQEFAKLFDGDYSVDKLVEAMAALGETARQAGTQVEASKIEILVGLALAAAEIIYAIAMAPWTFGASMAWIPPIEALTMAAVRALFNQLLRALVRRAIEALTKTTVSRLLREVAQQSAEEVAEELITNLAIQQYQIDQGHKDKIDWDDVGTAAKGAAAGGAAAGLIHGPTFGALGGKHGHGGIGNAFAGAGASYAAEVGAGVVGAVAVGGNLDAGEIFAGGALGAVSGGIDSSHGHGDDAPHGSPDGLDGDSHAFDPDNKTPDGNNVSDKGPDAPPPYAQSDPNPPPPYQKSDPNPPPPYQQHPPDDSSNGPNSSVSQNTHNSHTAATGAPQPQPQPHNGPPAEHGGNQHNSQSGSQQAPGNANNAPGDTQQTPGDGQTNQAAASSGSGGAQNGQGGSQQTPGATNNTQSDSQQTPGGSNGDRGSSPQSPGEANTNHAVNQHDSGNGQSNSQQSTSDGPNNNETPSHQAEAHNPQSTPQQGSTHTDNPPSAHQDSQPSQNSGGAPEHTPPAQTTTNGSSDTPPGHAETPPPDSQSPASGPSESPTTDPESATQPAAPPANPPLGNEAPPPDRSHPAGEAPDDQPSHPTTPPSDTNDNSTNQPTPPTPTAANPSGVAAPPTPPNTPTTAHATSAATPSTPNPTTTPTTQTGPTTTPSPNPAGAASPNTPPKTSAGLGASSNPTPTAVSTIANTTAATPAPRSTTQEHTEVVVGTAPTPPPPPLPPARKSAPPKVTSGGPPPKLPPPPRRNRDADVSSDETWRHDPATTAEWFEPLNPAPVKDIDDHRAEAFVQTVDTEVADTLSTSTPTSTESHTGLIRYDLRRIKVAPNKFVQEYTVKLNVTADNDPDIGPDTVTDIKARVKAGVDTLLNNGNRLPNGDEFRVNVEFTDTGAHAYVKVGDFEENSQTKWRPDATENVLAHEILHYLGVPDEGRDARIALRRHTHNSGVHDTDGGMMTSEVLGHDPRLRPRHLWMVERTANSQLSVPTSLLTTADNTRAPLPPRVFDESSQPAETRRAPGVDRTDGADDHGGSSTEAVSAPVRDSLPVSEQSRADVESWIGDVNNDGDASVPPAGERLTNCGPTTWVVFDRLSGTPSFGRAHPMQLRAEAVGEATGLPLRSSDPDSIAEQLRNAGTGAHTVVVAQFDNGVAHSFNALFDGNQIWAIDGQHGTITAWPPTLDRPNNPVTNWFAGTPDPHGENPPDETTVTGLGSSKPTTSTSADPPTGATVGPAVSTHVLTPFGPGSKQLNTTQHAELDLIADGLVERAQQQLDAGRGGLHVRAEGGGNGGRISRGADVVGQERAGATLDYLRSQIGQRLEAAGMARDAVTVSRESTSRGPVLRDELVGSDEEKRRTVLLTVEERLPARPVGPPAAGAEGSRPADLNTSATQAHFDASPVSSADRDEVLGRLAAGDVVSLLHAGEVGELESARNTVRDRLRDSFRDRHEHVDSDLEKMVELLENSRITINFQVDEALETLLSEDGETAPSGESSQRTYLNAWQRGAFYSEEFADLRDEAERMTGQYDGHEPPVDDESPQDVDARRRVNDYLSRQSPNFQPSARPRYGALDYGQSLNGAAPGYGSAYFVLKEHVKHRATFTANDSMQGNPTGSTFLGMTQLLARTRDSDFRSIHRLATTGEGFEREKARRDPATGTDTNYLEAQIHTPIDFFRDIEAVSIDLDDMNRIPSERRTELNRRLRQYAETHNVRLEVRRGNDIVTRDIVAEFPRPSSSAHAGATARSDSGDDVESLRDERDTSSDSDSEDAESETNPTMSQVVSGLPTDRDGGGQASGDGQHVQDSAGGPVRDSLPVSGQSRADIEAWIGDVNNDGDASIAPAGDRLTNCGPTTWVVFDRLSGIPSFGRAHPMQLRAQDVGEATGLPLRASNPDGIAEQLRNAGTGAHTVVVAQFDNGVAHSFNALFDGNQLWAIDGQHGTITAWPPNLDRPNNPVTNWFAGTPVAQSTGGDTSAPRMWGAPGEAVGSDPGTAGPSTVDAPIEHTSVSSTGQHGDVLHLPFDEGTTSVDGRRHAEVEAFVSRVVSAAESRRDAGETGLVLHAQGGGNGGMLSRGAHAIGLERAEAALGAIRPRIERALHEKDIPADFVTIAAPTSRGTALTDDISGPDDQARRRVVVIRIENQPQSDDPADDDGDGWVVDADGMPHWGRYGAAGLLLRARNSDGVPVVLLQRRAQWSDQGGTWGLPGGARSRLETPAQAALRETHEETGLQDNRFRVRTNLVTARAPGIDWTYSTVIGDAPYPLKAESSHEGSHRWVPIDAVTELPLHPGLAESWDALREHMAANPPMPARPSPQLDPSVDPTDVSGGYAIDSPDGALIFRDDNDLLYREDTRPPEVIFAEGFAINPVTRGLSKVFDFISTTRNPELGYLPPDSNQRRFRYTIDAPGGLDVNRTVGIGPSAYQQEVSFPGGIRRENIASAVEILPPNEDSSAAGAGSPSSAPKYGPVVRNEHFNPDLPNENAPAVLQGPIGGRPAPDDDTSSVAFGSTGTSMHFHREDEPDSWDAYMAGLADSSGEVRQASSSSSAGLEGGLLRLPFREGTTAVDERRWHVEIEDFVSRVVTAAGRRRDAGKSGLILHAQGGGNGGRFSRGADAVGQERAQTVIDAIRPLIERSLQQNSMPADFVTIAAPTSRGTALPEDVSGPDDQVRRVVVVRVEASAGQRPPAPLPDRTTRPATTGIRGAVSGLPTDQPTTTTDSQPTAPTDQPAAHTHPAETTGVKSESDPEQEFFDARDTFDDDAESEQEFFDARGTFDAEDDEAGGPVVETTVDLESEADTEQEFFDLESEADTEQEFFDAHESLDDTPETEDQPDPQLPARIGPDLALGGSDSIEMFRSGATGDAGLQHIRQVVEREGGPSAWELHRADLAALFSDDSIRPNAPGMLRGGRTITHTIDLGKGRALHVELRLDGASPDSTLRFKKEEKAGGEFEHASDSTVETGTSREGRITGLGGIQGSVTHANATDTAPLIGSIERQRVVAQQRADRQISGGRDEEPGSRFEGQIQAIITTRRVGRLDPAGPVRRRLSKMVSPGSEPTSNIVSSDRIPYSIEVFIPSREVSRDGQDESRDHVGPLPGDSAVPPSGGPPRISQTHALGGSDVVSNFWFVADDPSPGSPRRQTVSDLVDSASMTRTFQSAFGEQAKAAMHETSNWLTVEKVQANLHGMTNKQPLVLQYQTVPGATLEVHAFVEPLGTPLHTNSGQSPPSGSTPNPMMRPGGETSRTEFHYGSETDSSTVRQNARTRALQLPIPGRFRGAGGTDTGEASGGFDANHTRGVSRDQSSSLQFRHRNTLKTPVPGEAWRGQVRLRFVISNRHRIAEDGRRFDAVAHETLGHFDMMSEKSESTPIDDFRGKTVWAPPQRIWGDPPADTRSQGKRQRSNPISILANRPTITRGEEAVPSRGLGSMDRVTNLDVNGLRGMLDVVGSHAWGSAWKKQRSTVLNSFHLNRIRAALPAMTQHSPLVYTGPGGGKVAVTADFEQLTFRRVVETLASPSYEVSEGPAGGVTRNRQTGGQGGLGGRGGDVADGSVLGEVIVGGSQAKRSGDRFRDRRREAVGTKFDQRLAVFEGWVRLDAVATGPKATSHESGLFPVEIAIPLSELQGEREHDTLSPPSFSREQAQGFVIDRTGPAMTWTPVAHENPPEPPRHAFNEAWHPSDMVVGVERASGLLEAMRDDLAPVLGKQLDDAIQSLSEAYGPEVLTPRLVHESGKEWSHVVPLQVGSITVKVRPVRDARSAEYVGPSEKYEIDLIAESQSLTGTSHSDVGSTIVGGRVQIPVPHGSVMVQGTRTTQRPAGPTTDRDGHVTDPASENTNADIDRRTVFRDRNVQPYNLFRQPIAFQISYEAHGLAVPLTLQESYPSAPRPVQLAAVFAYPKKAPALDAAPREPGERAGETLRLDPRQSVVAVRPHSSDGVPDERASTRTEERTAGEDLIGTHVLDSVAPQGRQVFGAAWPRVRAELAEHVNTVAVQRRLRQFGTDAVFVVDLKSVRGGKVSLSGRIDTIGTAQPDGVSEIYRGGQTNRSVGTSASKATSWQGYVQAQGDLLPGDPGTNVSLLGRVDLGSGRGVDNTRTQLAGTGLQVRQRKDALGRAATASVTAEMSRPAGLFESGGTVRATGTAGIAFTIREQTTGDPGLGRLLEGNAVGRPLSNKTVVEDISGGDGLRVSTLADLHAASWGDRSTRNDVKTVLGDGSLSASLPAMTRGPVELFRRGALSIVGRVEMQPLRFKEVRAGNHTTNSLNEVNQVVGTRNIQSLESGARLLAGPHWSVPGFNGSLLAGIGGGGRVRRGESSSETAKTTSNSRYQLPYVVFAGTARITLTARDGTTSRELTAVDLGGQFLIPTDETRAVEPPAQNQDPADTTPTIVVAETIPESEEPPPAPTAPPSSPDDPASDESAVGMATTVDRGKAKATAADYEAWDREERDRDLAALEVAREELQTYQAELDAVLADPSATPRDRSVALGNRHDAHRYLDSVREDFENRWQPNPKAARDQRPPAEEARMAADLGGPAESGVVRVQARPSPRGGLGLPVADSASGRRNDVPEFAGITQVRPTSATLSAAEFAAVVDAVVPAGRAVEALDCGPLVRALVDWLYGGRVRPLGVSDDAAGVRGGAGGARDQVVAGGGWAQVNGAAGTQQLADGLPVGSTVVAMTSPLRGKIGHVVAARVTTDGPRWADPQRPTERTGAQVPPEVASAPSVWAVVIDPMGQVVDPQTWPVVPTSSGGSVSALLPPAVDGVTDRDLTGRFGAYQGHPGNTGGRESDSDVEMTNAADDVASEPDADDPAGIVELQVPGDGWCLLYSVVASTPPRQWNPHMYQGWAASASEAHRQVREQLVDHQAPVSDASSPLSRAAEGLRQLVMDWVRNRAPSDLPSDVVRPFRSSLDEMDNYEEWLAGASTDELRNQLSSLGIDTTHALDWMSAAGLRELTVQARAQELSENDPAMSVVAAHRQAESDVPHVRSRRGALAGPASQRDYLRRRGVGMPVDLIVDDEDLRSVLRVERQDQPLTRDEHQRLLDTLEKWQPSTSTWADDMGEMFPGLIGHALGVRLRNRSTAGTHDVGPRNAPPVNVFHNGVDHWNASTGAEQPRSTTTVLHRSLPSRPAPIAGQSRTTFPDTAKTGGSPESSESSDLSDPDSSDEEDASSDDGDDYRDSVARPYATGTRGLPVARHNRVDAPKRGRISPTDTEARRKRARMTEPASSPSQPAPARGEVAPKPTAPSALPSELTAATVEAMLRDQKARPKVPGIQIARNYPGNLLRTKRWLAGSSWGTGTRTNLPKELSQMPDYEEHREAIADLLRELGLYDRQLPEPQAAPKPFGADDLVHALRSLIELRKTHQKIMGGQSKGMGKGRLLLILAKNTGYTGNKLTELLTTDGNWRPPRETLTRLPGYERQREELGRLFGQLGHDGLAQDMPHAAEANAPAAGVTVAKLAAALTQIAANPGISLHAVGTTMGISRVATGKYLAPDAGGLRIDPEWFTAQPDYAEHRDAIQASLRQIGQDGQADRLPPAFAAAELVEALRSNDALLVDAIARMRLDPELSPHTAGSLAGMTANTLAAFTSVVDRGPSIRAQPTVETHLRDTTPYLRRELAARLEDMTNLARGRHPVGARRTDMTKVTLPGAGSAPDRMYVVHRGVPATVKPGKATQLALLYRHNDDLVRPPRSYQGDRPRQALRWLATALKEQLEERSEVQAYLDAGEGTLYVSSNSTALNHRLETLLASGSNFERALEGRAAALDPRRDRHVANLRDLLRSPVVDRGDAVSKIVAALKDGRVVVPAERYTRQYRTGDGVSRAHAVDLHAERRIMRTLKSEGRAMNLDLLAGTMRACGFCAADLEFEPSRPRGPLWLSRNATFELDADAIIDDYLRRSIGTYATRTRRDKITVEYDTDSDSDATRESAEDQPGPQADAATTFNQDDSSPLSSADVSRESSWSPTQD
ncbi:DUF3626 domain-containing protein [Mycobacterium sp. 21AC1]|uniref:DUF3626 domain-containing protein n=1 Tax=[Mycobacterium] appelbergii TaxID=2939269 RepID=UPI002938FB8B|nr:DUF3626 domain-containing protein [Mycobacterium sp. 21AC1]MDV3128456.1 DUF3626 domain-containing protein [Mycobacterium sp. 21AC1]